LSIVSLHVTTAGRGPELVLLHGWALNSHVWDGVLPRLNERFTTVRVDLPGHGQSSWPPAFHDVDSLADAIAPAVAHEETCVLGWSLGAMAALAVAAGQTARIRRMVLLAATPKFVRSEDWPHGVDSDALQEMARRLVTDPGGTVRDFLALQVHGDEHARTALKSLRENVREGGEPHPQALGAGLQALARCDLRPRLAAIDIPTLVISGGKDRLSHPKAGEAMAAVLPLGQFHLMSRAAHAPFLSHPDEFCTQVERFLAA
jgi:pimeloyl-[acyl-carrier protein] methyl ester esterase